MNVQCIMHAELLISMAIMKGTGEGWLVSAGVIYEPKP